MKHKRFLYICLAVLAVLSFACDPIEDIDDDSEPVSPDASGNIIGIFYVENRNMNLRLVDVTDQYQQVHYMSQAVPVDHLRYNNLPKGLRETVKSYGLSGQTRVFRMKWKGETVYHLICTAIDDIGAVYKASGTKVPFAKAEDFIQFLKEISDVNCILLIDVEVVKNAEGAPNRLIGTWQMDWVHLHHDIIPNSIDEQVALYDDLPFTITEVCRFKEDGTGYLRSVKTFKNGDQEVALDPFTYQLTDFNTNGSGSSAYQGYYYLCCFAAGDTIEYTARSRDGFSKVFDRAFTFVTYPWYKTDSDSFSDKNGDPKYGIPGKDSHSTIVGRWTGYKDDAAFPFGKTQYTWVFRNDGTGYLLVGRQFYQSFAYTSEGADDNLQLTIYKYDTGFFISDGFWTVGDGTYSYASQPTPKGNPMKARIYGNGDSLELEGWNNRAADLSQTPVVFQRVNR